MEFVKVCEAMTETVAVGEFEGPLGLLLELVERGKIEVSSISVSHITAKYLERLKALTNRTPEELGEFLSLGARLVYIKSLALLPQASPEEQGEELRLLNLELTEYRRMHAAARWLGRATSGRTWLHPITESLAPHDIPFPNVEVSQLAEAFTRALKRTEPAQRPGIIRRHVSLESVTKRLRHNLEKGRFMLQELLDACSDRLEIIVTFLALLELLRDGTAIVVQAGQFEPIIVEAQHG
jgi:segregation and condensation protein A